MNTPTTTTPLLDRINRSEQRGTEPFIAPWRRRQIEQAEAADRRGGRFVAVHDTTGTVAA
jgi:hypothetical protein